MKLIKTSSYSINAKVFYLKLALIYFFNLCTSRFRFLDWFGASLVITLLYLSALHHWRLSLNSVYCISLRILSSIMICIFNSQYFSLCFIVFWSLKTEPFEATLAKVTPFHAEVSYISVIQAAPYRLMYTAAFKPFIHGISLFRQLHSSHWYMISIYEETIFKTLMHDIGLNIQLHWSHFRHGISLWIQSLSTRSISIPTTASRHLSIIALHFRLHL